MRLRRLDLFGSDGLRRELDGKMVGQGVLSKRMSRRGREQLAKGWDSSDRVRVEVDIESCVCRCTFYISPQRINRLGSLNGIRSILHTRTGDTRPSQGCLFQIKTPAVFANRACGPFSNKNPRSRAMVHDLICNVPWNRASTSQSSQVVTPNSPELQRS